MGFVCSGSQKRQRFKPFSHLLKLRPRERAALAHSASRFHDPGPLSWLDVSAGVILIQCPLGCPPWDNSQQGLPGGSRVHAPAVLGRPESGAGRGLIVLQPERRTWKGLSPRRMEKVSGTGILRSPVQISALPLTSCAGQGGLLNAADPRVLPSAVLPGSG